MSARGFRDNCNYHVSLFKRRAEKEIKVALGYRQCYPEGLTDAPSPPPRHDRLAALIHTAHAIGALDGALAASPVARFWRERASIVGLANCFALAGVSLTPAEFFRGAVGLVEPVFFAELDRSLVSAIVAECLPDLGPRSLTARLLARLQRTSRLLVGDEWSADRRPMTSTRNAVAEVLAAPPQAIGSAAMADVGTALPPLAGVVTEALAVLRAQGERDWHGWLVAARLPAVLARLGITSTPLPCLTGLARAMRYSTAGSAEIEVLLAPRLGEQSRDGLALLRRLEACAQAWRGRLEGLTARSRAGQAAGTFLVWPALTRAQLAAALGTTQAGAGKVLEVLVDRGIVERVMFGGAAYFVAHESLGEFKIAARQGPQVRMPAMTAALAAIDASMAAFDLLGIKLENDGF